ncbi:MAG: hypothetical protein HZB15_04520, partial [Actinobacteria bacterium]|nr:hypothetical protein [Actinomycetota bacterium]
MQTFADGIPPRPLADGMALVDRDETTPGFDWSGDGDRNDRVTSLLTGTTLRNLGVNALAGISLGDGTLLLAVDEADGGDRNGYGDVADLVAAVFDGSSMIDLDLAVGQSGTNPATVGFARLGPGAGLLGVSEAAQGSDLDNDGSATHTVTFALTTHGTTSPPQFRSVTPTR